MSSTIPAFSNALTSRFIEFPKEQFEREPRGPISSAFSNYEVDLARKLIAENNPLDRVVITMAAKAARYCKKSEDKSSVRFLDQARG